MDLAKRAIANLEKLKADPASFTLAKAIESEITEAEWTKLRNLYFAIKQHATEHADPDQIDADFPHEVLAGHGNMVGYYEILPNAKPVEFTLGADTWLLDDQYCVCPTYSCREAALSLIRLRPSTGLDSSPIDPSLMRRNFDLSGLATLVRVWFNRAGKGGDSRSQPATAPVFREGVNVLFARTQEIEEIHA
jgi:hypothetical protein